ncbi:MAG: MFS transporter [Paracoccaceae bacterium]|uniref:MFS transporter n=1 Tax=Candidatus Salinivivens marinus TaxID=3381703 RepID=UPI000BDFD59B|nr:MAG: MFS transporter [Rhodobacteraceae bacterium MED-G08]|tara:strand:- start:4385 stop:5749 length:1365 start_codon:yes stop_codon:yes gene_type:complete
MLTHTRTLSVGQKAGWGLADMGIVVFVIVKQLLVLSFLTNYLNVPVGIAGLLTTSVLIFDIITDPIVGYLSDRTHSRWGRRVPWMVIGALILSGGIIGLFGVPQSLSLLGTLIWVGGFFALATVGFTMVAIPYGATAGEMTQDPKERSTMMGFRMAFASVGILLGGAVIPQLAGGTRDGHFTAAIYVAPIIILSIWGSLWSTRTAPRILSPSARGFMSTWLLVFKNKPFVILVCLYGIMTLAIALITAGLPFAAIYLIFDSGNSLLSPASSALGILSLLFACFVFGSILSQAFWVWMSARLGKVSALIFGLVIYIILLIAIFLSLPSVDIMLIAILFVVAGMTNGAYQQIPWAIYPDLMDITRSESGDAIEGAFSAIWLFGQKVSNAIAPLILSLILALFGWRESGEGFTDQVPGALRALQNSITILPAFILALAILGLFYFSRYLSKYPPRTN